MNMRVARPTALVDLNAIDELSFIRDLGDGLEIGAMTRQRSIERSSVVAERCPLLAAAMPHIAHFQICNRGTLGGSLAHNDPAAELPAVIAALDGTLTLASAQGRRDVDWRDFFCGLLSTALATDEILISVRMSALPPGTGVSFAEVSRRHGDFALAGTAAALHCAKDGTIDLARLVLFGVDAGPVRSSEVEHRLIGNKGSNTLWREAGDVAIRDIEPTDDLHASAEYRRETAAVLARRALARAWEGAHGRRT